MVLLQEAAIFVGDHVTMPIRKQLYERDHPKEKIEIKRVVHRGPSIFAGAETIPWHGPFLKKPGQKQIVWHLTSRIFDGSTRTVREFPDYD